jgi:thymidine kinase
MAKGRLEVICGSMFSGKSDELIGRLRRAEFARLRIQVFKHSLDTRTTLEHIHAHNGSKLPAIPVDSPLLLQRLIDNDAEVIGIDEVQFFSPHITQVIMQLVKENKRVIAAGLDLDFRGLPFGNVPQLLALADQVTKLTAVCVICGDDAHHTQRLVNGQPAPFDGPLIVIGAQESYQPRCRACYHIQMPDSSYYLIPAQQTKFSY